MFLKKSAALLAILLGTALPACRANQSLEGQARDAKLAAQIKAKIASTVGAATITGIEVNVTNGVVTLAGPVHSAQESQRIESAARGVEGVANVQNAMQILGQEAVTPAAGSSASGSPALDASPPAPTPAR